MTVRAEAIEESRRALLACRNSDGGWGYQAGTNSRLEPTAWGLLAFAGQGGPGAGDEVARIVDLIARWQRPDGLLACVPSAPANLAFNGLTALALMHTASVQPSVPGVSRTLDRLVHAIAAVRGNAQPFVQRVLLWLAPSARTSRQDDGLRGWPWVHDTFSWVEPTGWCLLALKRSRMLVAPALAADRIEEAEHLLMDRCCVRGGWNYGNSNMLGKELTPYVPTTAIGLLALQDRKGTPEVRRSVEFLVQSRKSEISGMALSLTLIALRSYGLPAQEVEDMLADHVTRARTPGNNATRAMALCALTGGSNEARPFVV